MLWPIYYGWENSFLGDFDYVSGGIECYFDTALFVKFDGMLADDYLCSLFSLYAKGEGCLGLLYYLILSLERRWCYNSSANLWHKLSRPS
jgi:hypothetical protein